jgi:hypothetical protein
MTTTTAPAVEIIAPDEAAVIAEFISFLKSASARRYPTGVIRRFNQARHTACVDAEFTVLDTIPGEHRVGLFSKPRTYDSRIRFANASSASDRERDVRGMSIKLLAVDRPNLTPGADAQDFVLNSHPVMMAAGPKEFLDLLKAVDAGGWRLAQFFLTHPRSALVAIASRQHPTSHLDIPYWSTTPYLFGSGRVVKYVARPCSTRKSAMPPRLTDTYLRDAISAHLQESDACFDFMVQFQTDARTMPTEDATVEWKERDSPYHPVARIRIPAQRIDAPGREQFCEQVAFNPWNCLADHRPLGSMNRARRDIYHAMALFRRARG